MSDQDTNIDRFRTRIALILTCKHAALLATIWTFGLGTLVLILRAAFGVSNEVLLWGLLGLPLTLVAGFVIACGEVPSHTAVRSLLDNHNHCGGLLMAQEEVDVGAWRQQVQPPKLPPVRWKGERSWSLLLVGSLFLMGSFLVPRHFAADPDTRLDVEDRVNRLTQQVQVLKEEKFLDAARAEEMQTKLGQIKDEARGSDPVKALEPLDRVEDLAKQRTKEAVEQTQKQAEELGKSEALADLLRKKKKAPEGGLSDRQRAEAMQELARLTREAMKGNEDLLGETDKDLLDHLQDGNLSPEDLEKLKKALEGAKGDLKKRLGKLAKVKLIDADKLKECEKCGDCDADALMAYLKKCEGKCSIKEAMKGIAGKGGLDRGPAPADLAFNGETDELKEKLRESALPQASLDKLKESKKAGVSISAPQIAKPGGQTTSGALEGAGAGSGSAQTQVVLPRHRGAVERYFERTDKK